MFQHSIDLPLVRNAPVDRSVEDGDLVLPPRYSRRLVVSGCVFAPASAAYAAYLAFPFSGALACACLGLFLLSVNYWRRPLRNSWRRLADVAMAYLIASCQTVLALVCLGQDELLFKLWYFASVLSGVAFYLAARRAESKNVSSFLHVLLHASMASSNAALYTGLSVLVKAPLESLTFTNSVSAGLRGALATEVSEASS